MPPRPILFGQKMKIMLNAKSNHFFLAKQKSMKRKILVTVTSISYTGVVLLIMYPHMKLDDSGTSSIRVMELNAKSNPDVIRTSGWKGLHLMHPPLM